MGRIQTAVAPCAGIKKGVTCTKRSLPICRKQEPSPSNHVLLRRRTDDGRTALHWAAAAGLTDVAEALLVEPVPESPSKAPAEPAANGAAASAEGMEVSSVTVVGAVGAAGVVTAAEVMHVAAAPVVAPPPLVELQDRLGSTPLHLAARGSYPGVLALLLAGAPQSSIASDSMYPQRRHRNAHGSRMGISTYMGTHAAGK